MNNCEDNNNSKKLELNLKIEREKTRQLELLKDIKKIEKSIKEKELYIKRNKSVCLSSFLKKNKKYTESESGTEIETESESEIESEFESETESESDYQKTDFILDCINIKCIKKKENDTISISSLDSDYDYDREINIEI